MSRPPAPTTTRTFSVEEVGEVIRTASALARREDIGGTGALVVRDALRFDELVEVAKELGIPESIVARAIPEAEARRARAEKRTRRKMGFWRHLLTFAIVNGGLAALDYLGGPGWGFHVVAIPWGIFVLLHGSRVFLTAKGGALHEAVYKKELEAEQRSG